MKERKWTSSVCFQVTCWSLFLSTCLLLFLGSSSTVCAWVFLCPCFCLGLCVPSHTLSVSDPSCLSRLSLSLSKSALSFLGSRCHFSLSFSLSQPLSLPAISLRSVCLCLWDSVSLCLWGSLCPLLSASLSLSLLVPLSPSSLLSVSSSNSVRWNLSRTARGM